LKILLSRDFIGGYDFSEPGDEHGQDEREVAEDHDDEKVDNE
jgi:hypothetical protein